MNDKEKKIEEYLQSDSEDKEAKRKVIKDLPYTDENRILLELKESIQQEEKIGEIRKKINDISVHRPKQLNWYWIGAAASVVIGSLYFVLIGWESSKNVSNEDLYATYFEVYPNILSERTDQDSLVLASMELYEKKLFDEALLSFKKINAPSKLIILYTSICELELGKTTSAIQNLEKLKGESSGVSQIAQWYISLAYLKLNNIDRAKLEWEDMKEKSYKSNEARELLTHFN